VKSVYPGNSDARPWSLTAKNIQQPGPSVWPTLEQIKKGSARLQSTRPGADDLALTNHGLIEKANAGDLLRRGSSAAAREELKSLPRRRRSRDTTLMASAVFRKRIRSRSAAGHARRGVRELGRQRRIPVRRILRPDVKIKTRGFGSLRGGLTTAHRAVREFCKPGRLFTWI